MTTARSRAEFDAVDRSLLMALQRNAREPLTGLAGQLHLGVSATRARLQKLQESGVLMGFTAAVDPHTVGFTLHAVVRMKVHGSLYDKVAAVLDREPQIVRCLRITGESCYLAEILARDMADLERITSELARIGSITTDLVYEVVADKPTPVADSAHPTDG